MQRAVFWEYSQNTLPVSGMFHWIKGMDENERKDSLSGFPHISAVHPETLVCLTSVFEKGTGKTIPLLPSKAADSGGVYKGYGDFDFFIRTWEFQILPLPPVCHTGSLSYRKLIYGCTRWISSVVIRPRLRRISPVVCRFSITPGTRISFISAGYPEHLTQPWQPPQDAAEDRRDWEEDWSDAEAVMRKGNDFLDVHYFLLEDICWDL